MKVYQKYRQGKNAVKYEVKGTHAMEMKMKVFRNLKSMGKKLYILNANA